MDYVMVERYFLLQQANCVPADLLEDILAIIQTSLQGEAALPGTLFRSKYILTELITNALKHSNAHETNLGLQLYNNKLRFVKTDTGNKLSIPAGYKEFNGGNIITSDIMHTLYAVNKAGHLHFYCRENNEPVFDAVNDLPEHFGLLIITKASDEFYYTYDADSNLNTFSVTINF